MYYIQTHKYNNSIGYITYVQIFNLFNTTTLTLSREQKKAQSWLILRMVNWNGYLECVGILA